MADADTAMPGSLFRQQQPTASWGRRGKGARDCQRHRRRRQLARAHDEWRTAIRQTALGFMGGCHGAEYSCRQYQRTAYGSGTAGYHLDNVLLRHFPLLLPPTWLCRNSHRRLHHHL